MKKTLLILSLFSLGLSNAQVIINDDYNALTVGNFSSDVTGAVVGQGGYIAAGGTPASFNVVSEGGARGNVVEITGSNTASGTRFLFKNITTQWGQRTSGNNVIDVEFDLFTGDATTSKNIARVYLYNDTNVPLAGLSLNLETKALTGNAFFDPNNGGVNPVGFYTFNLGASNAVITLPPSTWVRVGLSYNSSTREVAWKGPGFYAGVDGATPSSGTTSPKEVDYVHSAGANNTVAATSRFDNLFVRAVATENLLGVEENVVTNDSFAIYPNPTSSILNISNTNNFEIKNISVVDINGRVVKNQAGALTQINVSDLNAGVYFVTIEAAEGKTTKKFIKQ
jgi:hypothetical protein